MSAGHLIADRAVGLVDNCTNELSVGWQLEGVKWEMLFVEKVSLNFFMSITSKSMNLNGRKEVGLLLSLFTLHFTLHSNLLTFGILARVEPAAVFSAPEAFAKKKHLQIWITYWLLARLCLHTATPLPTHTWPSSLTPAATPTHTLNLLHTHAHTCWLL